MSTKPQKSKQKIADITPPRKASGTALPQIVIEKRAHLERPEGPGADNATVATPPTHATAKPTASADTPAAASAPTPQVQAPTAPKRTVIAPPENTEAASPTTEAAPGDAGTETAAAAPTAPSIARPASTTADIEEDGNATADETVDETKAAKEAEAAARRDQELEKFIDTKQFFVPINKEAHKRSIKVTLWLTALYIFLSLVLVNLMLDTGMILLLQKLPHTNFFSV